jgi:hypothetical protein
VKGVVLNVIEDVVVEQHGFAAWEHILSDAGLDGTYTSLGNYPDSELHAIVSAAAALLGVTTHEVLETVGFHAFRHLYGRLPSSARQFDDPVALLSDLDGVIHPQVKVLYPDAKPPEFEIEHADGQLVVRYRSGRNLAPLAVGLIRGCFAHFGESVDVRTTDLVDGSATFEVDRPGTAGARG